MSNVVQKIIVFALAVCIALTAMPTASAEKAEAPVPAYFDLPVTVDTIKVGLRSGGTAVYEARLLNKSGSGYLFGYFDYSRQFHKVGNTEVSDL